MKKNDFYFELPEELIAQTPIERREQSRLLCVDRNSGQLKHRSFHELPALLKKGDCLVLNDTRVLPARLLGKRETGGAAEILLLRELQSEPGTATWECLVKPGKKIRTGTNLLFGNEKLSATVTEETDDGNRYIKFSHEGDFTEVLERLGKMPVPPYIHKTLDDAERYQTVYSRVTGSAAAPTAGLHFTGALLDELRQCGVEICFITLHVGLGTFRPVSTENIKDHKMHSEYFTVPEDTAAAVNRIKANGGRIIAVGTTSCRALESCANDAGTVSGYSGFTDIFIYPGHTYKCIDGLITNFHLPESTLIMLVSAFAGRENILNAYTEAIKERYRFFSFGDAMLII